MYLALAMHQAHLRILSSWIPRPTPRGIGCAAKIINYWTGQNNAFEQWQQNNGLFKRTGEVELAPLWILKIKFRLLYGKGCRM